MSTNHLYWFFGLGICVLSLGGCPDEVVTAALTPGAAGELPVEIHAMIFGDETPCRDGQDCVTGQCLFGRCSGLTRTDEQWRTELVTARLNKLMGDNAQLRAEVVAKLNELAMSAELSMPIRARLVWALDDIAGTAGLAGPKAAFDTLEEPLQGLVAMSLARHGDTSQLAMVLALTESSRPAIAIEALRALGGVGANPPTEVLARLLAVATGEAPHEAARAALGALAQLKDPRTLRTLIEMVDSGPDALREPVAIALRQMTTQAFGRDVAAWRSWADGAKVPEQLSFTPAVMRVEDDLGIPEP